MAYGATSSLLAMAWVIGLASPAMANPDGFPTKPITLIVPFPAGSQPDTIARFVGQHLSSRVGVTVIQNRPGAGGTTGTKAASLAAPDGYTLLLGTTGSLGIGPAFFPGAGYDAVKSFAPVAMLSSAPFMLVPVAQRRSRRRRKLLPMPRPIPASSATALRPAHPRIWAASYSGAPQKSTFTA